MISFESVSQNDLTVIVKKAIELGKDFDIWCFHGDLGAGKTTFIQYLAKELGILQTVSSPSYSIINEYENNVGLKVYHFDFYRITKIQELIDIGADEFLNEPNCKRWVEWPERLKGSSLLPFEECFHVYIEANNKGRNYRFEQASK